MAEYSEISAQSDVDFAVWMTREVGVACIPVSVFYQDLPPRNFLRFCFAKHDETLERAAELLCAI